MYFIWNNNSHYYGLLLKLIFFYYSTIYFKISIAIWPLLFFCLWTLIYPVTFGRVKFFLLTKLKDFGVLFLPNLQWLYWSAQLKILSNWFTKWKDSLWLTFESLFCLPRTLDFLPLDSIRSVDLTDWTSRLIKFYTPVGLWPS